MVSASVSKPACLSLASLYLNKITILIKKQSNFKIIFVFKRTKHIWFLNYIMHVPIMKIKKVLHHLTSLWEVVFQRDSFHTLEDTRTDHERAQISFFMSMTTAYEIRHHQRLHSPEKEYTFESHQFTMIWKVM